ncbi:MAG: peptidoglycan editing factor PgeF [Defluviitaleaceae bacterium]|nr:peptidoglycan editing factor PgeF [Defluviitaleaceae bacterium]
MKKNEKNGVVYYTFENLDALGIVRHGFSTRIGGVSRGPFEAMNLGFGTADDRENIKENYRLFCDAVGFSPENIVMSGQTHTTNIHNVNDASESGLKDIDGLVTDKADIVLVTYYADCVPLLLCDPVKKVIANCHAGWRGTAHNMAGKAVEKMMTDYGCSPRDIVVGIGPSISCKNFEVGPEVAEEFKNLLPFSVDFMYNSKYVENKFHIDLWGINRQSFIGAGLRESNIETAGMCTFDEEALFYSHRRSGGQRGSLAAFIAI